MMPLFMSPVEVSNFESYLFQRADAHKITPEEEEPDRPGTGGKLAFVRPTISGARCTTGLLFFSLICFLVVKGALCNAPIDHHCYHCGKGVCDEHNKPGPDADKFACSVAHMPRSAHLQSLPLIYVFIRQL